RAARWIRSKRRAGEFQFPDLHFAIASLAYQPGLRVGRSVERELEPRSGFRERPISARVERRIATYELHERDLRDTPDQRRAAEQPCRVAEFVETQQARCEPVPLRFQADAVAR